MIRARIVLITATLALLLAACNLALITAPTPTPSGQPGAPGLEAQAQFPTITPLPVVPGSGITVQTVYITATPFGAGPGVAIAITPGSGGAVTPSGSVIDSIINSVVIPAWNFLYTLVLSTLASLWNFAGARGGLIAQGLCCLIPGVVVVVAVVRLALARVRLL